MEVTEKAAPPITPGKPDIPKSKLKGKITDELIKSFITVFINDSGLSDFEIVSSNVKAEEGTYEVRIRLSDGSERTVKVNVVDNVNRDVQKPGIGKEEDCIIE